jgi:hypothetical protein
MRIFLCNYEEWRMKMIGMNSDLDDPVKDSFEVGNKIWLNFNFDWIKSLMNSWLQKMIKFKF